MSKNYKTSDIQEMDALDQIRLRSGMYIGDSETPTKLLIECLDNAIDEVENGFADKIFISIDTNTNEFIVADNGRGIPFDYSMPLKEDRPILICNSIFTSGKYKKNEEDSAYKISAGLHGVGMTCVNALSEYMEIEVFRDGKHASYSFKYKEEPVRNKLRSKSDPKFATIVKVKPHKDHFDTLQIKENVIKERLLIAASNFKNLEILFKVDDNMDYIKGSEDLLIETYLGKDVKEWHTFDSKLKGESCEVKLGWDLSSVNTKMDTFTTVNYVKVESGAHIKKITDIIENTFQKLAKKQGYEFNPTDALNWIKIYINLKIVDVEFESQTKEKLSKRSNLSVMEPFQTQIENYFKKYENVNVLLERFDLYRKSLQNKKLNKTNSSGKRGFHGFTKLRDCTSDKGELLIGEGASAVGNIVQVRDPKKHAILPLKGVPINVCANKLDTVLINEVVKDLITALGCGITPHCDIKKLRYSKIILSADADPAGEFITALLITLFAKLTPELIKNGYLYLCKTPLYGVGFGKNFQPLWTDKELENARSANKNVRRFKGLGEFDPLELKQFTLDESTRILEVVEWSDDMSKKLFEVMSDTKLRKDLLLGSFEY